jgi:hypothetical protein
MANKREFTPRGVLNMFAFHSQQKYLTLFCFILLREKGGGVEVTARGMGWAPIRYFELDHILRHYFIVRRMVVIICKRADGNFDLVFRRYLLFPVPCSYPITRATAVHSRCWPSATPLWVSVPIQVFSPSANPSSCLIASRTPRLAMRST